MEVGNVVCVAQVLLPPAKANGFVAVRVPTRLRSAFKHPCEMLRGHHQHEQFVSLRCLVNKNIAHSTCTRLSSFIINFAISISL